jgi:hypothetical protein
MWFIFGFWWLAEIIFYGQISNIEGLPLDTPFYGLSLVFDGWHTISLNFIEGLPRSAHTNCILVVIDNFSKYDHFFYRSHIPSQGEQNYRIHGMIS